MTNYSPVPQSPYQFVDLQTETSFRVLELLPGRDDAPISSLLHLADWTRPHEYEAVSYAWGDPELKATIKCHGNGSKWDEIFIVDLLTCDYRIGQGFCGLITSGEFLFRVLLKRLSVRVHNLRDILGTIMLYTSN
jgi:hypothetical protein